MKQDNKNVKPCLIEGCKRDTYNGARGMCTHHYAVKLVQVKMGRTTWEELEKAGIARRPLTQEEKNENQKHPQRNHKIKGKPLAGEVVST